MDTKWIEEILLIAANGLLALYVLALLLIWQTKHATSVRSMWWIALWDKLTRYLILPIFIAFAAFELVKQEYSDNFIWIPIQMVLVIVLMYFIKVRAILNYKYLKDCVLELYVVEAKADSIFYLLIEENGRQVWQEITTDPELIGWLDAENGDTFFVSVVETLPGEASPLRVAILDAEAYDAELQRREAKKQQIDEAKKSV